MTDLRCTVLRCTRIRRIPRGVPSLLQTAHKGRACSSLAVAALLASTPSCSHDRHRHHQRPILWSVASLPLPPPLPPRLQLPSRLLLLSVVVVRRRRRSILILMRRLQARGLNRDEFDK
jgi:hypothetical protein